MQNMRDVQDNTNNSRICEEDEEDDEDTYLAGAPQHNRDSSMNLNSQSKTNLNNVQP